MLRDFANIHSKGFVKTSGGGIAPQRFALGEANFFALPSVFGWRVGEEQALCYKKNRKRNVIAPIRFEWGQKI